MITIYNARDTSQFVHYADNGLGRFSYGGSGEDCYVIENEPWRGEDVKSAVERMQSMFPLGWIDDYEVLCLNVQLAQLDTSGKPMFRIDGERFNGFIALSASSETVDLFDLVSHELTHEWWRRLRLDDQMRFFNITNLAIKSTNDERWHERPQELAAEHITTALFGTPLDERMTRLPDDVYAQIRLWAFAITPIEEVEIVVASNEIRIELDVDSDVATVNGETKTLDVPAMVVNGRTLVPLRFIAEALGYFVHFDDGHITITKAG